MTDKEAMKLALEALESYQSFIQDAHIIEGQWHWIDGAKNAITALEERLAQPEQTEVQQLIALVRAQQITIDKLEMALADPMREVQRLGQEIEQEPVAVYGYCPECGAKGVQRERRPNGNDKCANGHTYPSSKAAQPEQEPICPACKAEVLYECVACSSNNYPQKENT